jgi:hypothetical protein
MADISPGPAISTETPSSTRETDELPRCGCGRTLPRPMPCLWPATVFCPCGARHNFPRRETSAKVRAQAREMGRKRQAAIRSEKAKTVAQEEGATTPLPRGG